MTRDNPRQTLILAVLGLIPTLWLGLQIAPALVGGMPKILQRLTAAVNNPFHIEWCGDSLKTVLFFIAACGMGIGIYLSTKRNYRRREEHGSAKWGDVAAVNRRYRDKTFAGNKILTQNVRLGDNQYLADFGGVKCTAIFNSFVGRYYVDDKYGIIRGAKQHEQVLWNNLGGRLYVCPPNNSVQWS